ncbi:AI-2E family transporter [Patescibacteria group bacterium]|nr:AI-2E family transporter [Patescibacteria group bacterium]MBU4023153.1 AI-2E family transporter [Patescibacteria group bacterium]
METETEEQSFPSIPEKIRPQEILDISWATIVKIIIALGGLYLIFLVRDILIWFIFALIISILFNPAINFFRKLKVPRILACILVYLSIFVFLSLFIYLISPILFLELQKFTIKLPDYFNQLAPYLSGLGIEAFRDFNTFSETIGGILFDASSNIFVAIGTFFGGLMSAVAIFAIAFFLSLEEKGVSEAIKLASPYRYKEYISNVWRNSQKKVSSWFAVRIFCCIFIGLSAGITVFVLNIPYAASFGLLAGVSNIVVSIGPFLSGLVITLFVLAIGGLPKALIFLLAFLIAQQIESYVIMPVLTKKFLRLSPSLVLISLLMGAKLWGLMGAILAIPLVGMFYEFISGFLQRKQELEKNALSKDA